MGAFWRDSSDPAHPDVGFTASVGLGELPAGVHQLGLRVHGVDGSREDIALQPLRVPANAVREP